MPDDVDPVIPPQEQAERLVGMLDRDQLARVSPGGDRKALAFDIAARRHRDLQDPPPAEVLEAEVAEATEVAKGAAGLAGRVLGLLSVAWFIAGWAFLGGGGIGIVILSLTGQMDFSLLRERWYVQSANGIGGLLFLVGCAGLVVACLIIPLRAGAGRVVERRQRRALLDWAAGRGVEQLGRGVPAPDPNNVGMTRGCAHFAFIAALGLGGFFFAAGGAVSTLGGLVLQERWSFTGSMAGITLAGVLMMWACYAMSKGFTGDESDEDHLALTGVHFPEDRRTQAETEEDEEPVEDDEFTPDSEY